MADTDKVGEWLTVKRVKELNAKDWFYQMLKDNPEMRKIYPGIEDECMDGAIDHHIHAYPDFVYRSQDQIDIAIDAAQGKMRGVGFKDHYNLTAGAAYLTQRYIDLLVEEEILDCRVEVFGGMGFNFGMNVETAEKAAMYPKCKMFWFPTFNSAGYLRFAGKDPKKGVALVSDKGEVLPAVEEIVNIAVENKIGIGLGHTDIKELLPLAEHCKSVGARAVTDHPLLELNKLQMSDMKQIAKYGVKIGTYCQPMIPSLYQPVADPFETVNVIREIGAKNCCSGSDFGQVLHINSIDGVRVFIRALMAFGVKKDDINLIMKDSPAWLLYWD